LPNLPDLPHTPRPDVFVIGGGFAGLAAATALAEAGASVQLLEARPHLGGRATTHRDPITGERIDNGQHVLAGCYRETLAFLERIGASRLLHRPSTLTVVMIDEHGRRSTLTLPPLPAPLHLLAGVIAWNAISVTDRLSVLRLGPAIQGGDEPRPDLTVRQWLAERGQSAALCRMLWEPLTLAALNQPAEMAAATSFLTVLRRMFAPNPDAASILLPAVPLADLYVLPAETYLQTHGSAIATTAKASVVLDDNRVAGVRVRSDVHRARVVIAAVPWYDVAGLLPSPPASVASVFQQAAMMASSPIVTVNLWLDRPVLDDPFVGLPGRTFQWVFDRQRIVGSGQTHLSLVSSGADSICAAANQVLVAHALGELRDSVPAAARAGLRHSAVVRERRATFSLAPGGPARPRPSTPAAGLILAGDWTDTGLPATIESAVASGHAAARAALALLR
jgi:squalene-associated FAD-dependent desaturase